MHPILTIATQAALSAGKIILRASMEPDRIRVQEKGKNDFVTSVDLASERAILDIIRKNYPDHNIITEESGDVHESASPFTWYIDPIDGTSNFIHGIPHYAVSIGVFQDGKPLHGVIYDPVRDEMFIATLGSGAQLNKRRLRLSNGVKASSALIGTGFPYGEAANLDAYLNMFKEICPNTAGIRRGGSAALDLAYVAAGRLDGFWELGLKPWDMAAGILLVREAGGVVSDHKGKPEVMERGHIIAGSTMIHPYLQHIVSKYL